MSSKCTTLCIFLTSIGARSASRTLEYRLIKISDRVASSDNISQLNGEELAQTEILIAFYILRSLSNPFLLKPHLSFVELLEICPVNNLVKSLGQLILYV